MFGQKRQQAAIEEYNRKAQDYTDTGLKMRKNNKKLAMAGIGGALASGLWTDQAFRANNHLPGSVKYNRHGKAALAGAIGTGLSLAYMGKKAWDNHNLETNYYKRNNMNYNSDYTYLSDF